MPGFVIARLSVAAPVILAAALFAIPADEARAHNDYSATLHAETYPLHEAAKAGDLNSVNHFITVHMADVDAKDNDGDTPLHDAAAWLHGDASVVSILIAAGAEVNAKNNDDDTPLHYAARLQWDSDASVVSVLIAAGAEVNAKNSYGNTPLHYAARNPHASVVSVLIAAGADVDAKDNDGDTPLHYAAWRYGDASVVSILIAAGAEVNAKDDDDKTPLHDARYSPSVVSILIEAGGHWGEVCENAAVVNPAGPSPPCLCEFPNVGTPENCVRSRAQVCAGLTPPKFHSPTLSACAPYDECVAAGDCALSAHVCRQGFSPARFYDSATGECVPFAECDDTAELNQNTNQCECTKSSSSRYLRTSGVCESSCIRAETVVWKGRRNSRAYYECECAADTVTDVNGACELLYPCHDSAIRKADNSGCECPAGSFAHGDPSGGYHRSQSYDRYGERPIIPATAACHANHAPISHNLGGWQDSIQTDNPILVAHFIAEHGQAPDGNYELHLAVQHDSYSAAKALIEGGANVDLQRSGETPLHRAVRNGQAKIITLLLNRGANVDIATDYNDTPLHLAARRADTPENAALVSFLLDKGADPNIFNNNRWRPLDLADGRDGYPRRRKIMSALIAGGANWSDECVGGKVPNEFTPPKCKCPARLSIDNNGLCECPAHSHSQVNGRCLPQGSAEVDAEIAKMQVELARLRAALVSLNARLSLSAEAPRETVEDIAEQARKTAAEIDWRRANFVALGRRAEAGEAPPPVALSDTAAECRMRGGEVRIDSGSGTRICLGLDQSGTFCLVDSGDVFSCRGLFKHVRRCNDVYHRPALNAFICAARCDVDETARGRGCE